MKVHFRCPCCDAPARAQAPPEAEWQCPACGHVLPLPAAAPAAPAACAVCGNGELFKKKNFPHWLGLGILAAACLAFVLGHALYRPWLAWSVLLASAAFDAILYLAVGDAVVCYRCGASHSGVPAGPGHQPFELIVAERYRQERLRRAQLEAERRGDGAA